ncbi:MAG TPA: cell division protein ZapA [Bacteroidales bacterium]|nr:cell division protein ZapA [Bacteroidales bacterium]
MDEKLSIKVNVAERYYPLRIERDDEEMIRRAARMINEKVLQYKQKYVDKDTQDFIAMAALQFVIKLIESENRADSLPLDESLREMTNELDAFIKKSNSVL